MKPKFKEYKTTNTEWSYDKISSIQPFAGNRDVIPRVPKVIKMLEKKYSPKQLNYVVGLAVKDFEMYKAGDMFLLDGNTRTEVYRRRPDLIPPYPMKVEIYEFDNYKDADDTYESIDNQLSAEKSNERITGFHRKREFYPVSKIFKQGKYKVALEFAGYYTKNKYGVSLQKADFELLLDHFWDEIQFIDSQNLDTFKHMSGAVLVSLLMITKKYGTNNPKVHDLISTYSKGNTKVNNDKEVDGSHYVYHTVYEELKLIWSSLSYGKAKPLVSSILYGFDCFIKNETIKKKKNGTHIVPTREKLMDFYHFYLR
jgi:hypothetical protein